MMKIKFKWQMFIVTIAVIIGLIFSLYWKKDIFYNLAWSLCGFLFAINPVYPKSIFNSNTENIEKGVRIAGLIIIFIGLTNGFGV